MLRSCPPVVVATPGRLWDLITHGNKHLSHLDGLSFFVLDEADRMVQQVRGCVVCVSIFLTTRLDAGQGQRGFVEAGRWSQLCCDV